MICRRLVSILLALSLTTPLMAYSASAQVSISLMTSTASSTSYSTYTEGVTTFISTASNSIYDGQISLSPWGYPGCGTSFSFNALPGDQISVNFKSSTPIDFHVVSTTRFSGGADVFCGFGVPPPSLQEASYQTSYIVQWSPPTEYYQVNHITQYYIVLANWQVGPASVYLNAQETTSQMATSAIYATSSNVLPLLATLTFSSIQTIMSTPPSIQSTQSNPWIVIPLLTLILIGLAIAYVSRNRKKKYEKTQIY
jgi:hypothetical protein